MMAGLATAGSAMKRFVLAGLFFVLGLIILGAATSSLMGGPDKPARPPHPAAANADATPKGHGGQDISTQVNTQPLQSRNGSGQFGMPGGSGPGSAMGGSDRTTGTLGNLTQVPSTIVPLTTSVQPPTVRPNPPGADAVPHVPVLPQTDESSSRGTQQSTAK